MGQDVVVTTGIVLPTMSENNDDRILRIFVELGKFFGEAQHMSTVMATALIIELDDCEFIGWEIDEPIRRLMSDVANDADQALRFNWRQHIPQCIRPTAANAHRGGSVCLNSFLGLISGAPAGVKPPRHAAAG